MKGPISQRQNNDKVIENFPPPLSVSSARKHSQGSDCRHSDDDVEMRRGLESENVRTDMGSNPELLRQSTHSLLLKQEGKDGLNDGEKPAELQYLQDKTKSLRKSSNPLDK